MEEQIHQLLQTMKEAIDKLAKRHNKNKTPSPSHQSGSHNQPDINESFPSPPHGNKVFIALAVKFFFLLLIELQMFYNFFLKFGCYPFLN